MHAEDILSTPSTTSTMPDGQKKLDADHSPRPEAEGILSGSDNKFPDALAKINPSLDTAHEVSRVSAISTQGERSSSPHWQC